MQIAMAASRACARARSSTLSSIARAAATAPAARSSVSARTSAASSSSAAAAAAAGFRCVSSLSRNGSRAVVRQPGAPDAPLAESNQPVDAYFGTLVFDRRTMKQYLSSVEFEKFNAAIDAHKQIDFCTADAIAKALLRWATERGATHYTHWFQPITGTCAEKHDTFLDTLRDGETPLVRFTGKQLIMGEPDGSSFPSGGLRATHVARGYTAWDPHSPPFVLQSNNGACLYIPSCFFSWDQSYALDEKIPLLRSEVALARESVRLLAVLEEASHTRVHVDAGLEQEFFLIDRKFYLERPDLMLTGRTVVGAAPPKGQELEDQYFGPVTSRYLDCIHDFELQCWKLGIPIQTRHREVAPAQYEIAPKFAPGNVGTDRNLLLMEVLRRTARKHGLAALLHEKPFAGVNGSGKHNNWSLGTNEIPSLLDPGMHPEKNAKFLLFLAATLRAVDLHADLMRVAISGVGNDHRLGANEAPPAIVSAYLGDDLEQSLARFLNNEDKRSSFNTRIELGVGALPDLHRVQTDRNRTSTFAFTGNKFEFRAVGSSHNPARSNTVLNTIVADSVRFFADEIDKLKKAGVSVAEAQTRVTREALHKHSRIIFNGNGYSAEWAAEAARRGLPNLRTTPDALDTLYSPKNVELFEGMKVLTRAELQARANILFEDYTKRICIEGRVLAQIARTSVVPAAFRYQQKLAAAIHALEQVSGKAGAATKSQRALLERVTLNLNTLLEGADKLTEVVNAAHSQASPSASAHFLEAELKPLMLQVREASDALESVIEAKEWPLPTYHQMLFHQD